MPAVPVWLPGLVTVTPPLAVWLKSALNVASTPFITLGSLMIRPSSRLLLSELLEKFSEPRKTFAVEVP